jgi:hypothetical protein
MHIVGTGQALPLGGPGKWPILVRLLETRAGELPCGRLLATCVPDVIGWIVGEKQSAVIDRRLRCGKFHTTREQGWEKFRTPFGQTVGTTKWTAVPEHPRKFTVPRRG